MKKKIAVVNAIMIIMLISLSGCYYDSVLPQEPQGDVSFSLQVQSIFDSKCIACHNTTHVLDLEANVSYTNLISRGYVNTADPESSLLYQKINGGTMSGYASSANKATILKWIEQGAKNN